MSFAGSMGVSRRSWDIDAQGVYGPAAHLWLGVLGIGGVLAFVGLLVFALLCVGTLFLGPKIENRAMADWGTPPALAGAQSGSLAHDHYATKGTIVLVLVFLACFAVYYFANWKALADVWPVR
jgi:cytochrome c oxidase subunit 1